VNARVFGIGYIFDYPRARRISIYNNPSKRIFWSRAFLKTAL